MPNPAALDAFAARHAEALALTDAIRAELDDHLGYDPERIDWGHVGTMGAVMERLREMAEMIGATTTIQEGPR